MASFMHIIEKKVKESDIELKHSQHGRVKFRLSLHII